MRNGKHAKFCFELFVNWENNPNFVSNNFAEEKASKILEIENLKSLLTLAKFHETFKNKFWFAVSQNFVEFSFHRFRAYVLYTCKYTFSRWS
jgi:hypothetical protein